MNTQITEDDHWMLSIQYDESFSAAVGEPHIPRTSDELYKFADTCDKAARNLEKEVPALSTDLAKFANDCREIANHHSDE